MANSCPLGWICMLTLVILLLGSISLDSKWSRFDSFLTENISLFTPLVKPSWKPPIGWSELYFLTIILFNLIYLYWGNSYISSNVGHSFSVANLSRPNAPIFTKSGSSFIKSLFYCLSIWASSSNFYLANRSAIAWFACWAYYLTCSFLVCHFCRSLESNFSSSPRLKLNLMQSK